MTECSSPYNEIIEKIRDLSRKEKKGLLEKTIKLQEELGELAEAVLIHTKASGSQYKKAVDKDIESEIADILLVSLDIFFSLTKDTQLLAELLMKKCQKWEKYQLKKD